MNVTGLKTVVLALVVFSLGNLRESGASEYPLRDANRPDSYYRLPCGGYTTDDLGIGVFHGYVVGFADHRLTEMPSESPVVIAASPIERLYPSPAVEEVTRIDDRVIGGMDRELDAVGLPLRTYVDRYQSL